MSPTSPMTTTPATAAAPMARAATRLITTTEPRRAVVHVREFLADSLTPLAVYRRLAEISEVRFLLESVSGGEQVSRFSFLGAKPRELCRVYADRVELQRGGRRKVLPGAPLVALAKLLGEIHSRPGPIPFTGGYVGFFGYDMVRLIEHLPDRPADPYDLPIAVLGRFDTLVVFDHARQRVLAIANEIEGEVSSSMAERELGKLSRLLTTSSGTRAVAMPGEPPRLTMPADVSLGGEAFRRAVVRAKEYIAAGDIFQVVLARRFTVAGSPPPLAIYLASSVFLGILRVTVWAYLTAVATRGWRAREEPLAGWQMAVLAGALVLVALALVNVNGLLDFYGDTFATAYGYVVSSSYALGHLALLAAFAIGLPSLDPLEDDEEDDDFDDEDDLDEEYRDFDDEDGADIESGTGR